MVYATEGNKRRIQSAARMRNTSMESKRNTVRDGYVNATELLKMQDAFTIDEYTIHIKLLRNTPSQKMKVF